MSNRSYAIIGTGALGGFYGARLQKAGLPVHFLLRSDYDRVKEQGLAIDSPEGAFALPEVLAYRDVKMMPPCDVVAIALKTTQNHLLPQLLPPLLKSTTVVLVLQNGLGIEAEVAKIVGSDRVVGGVCILASNKIGPGHIQHIKYSAITLGEYAENYQRGGITERMRQIATDFEMADIPIELSEDLMLARWRKLVWNIPYNGLSVVLDATTEQLMKHPEARQLVEALMWEVVAGAKSCDRLIPESQVQQMLDRTDNMKPYRTSMKVDYDEGHPLEVEAIFGNPLRVAQKRGANLPKIEMLYQQLKFLDALKQLGSPS